MPIHEAREAYLSLFHQCRANSTNVLIRTINPAEWQKYLDLDGIHAVDSRRKELDLTNNEN